MERFILKYPNGKIRQQKGINSTYHYLLGLGAIIWIIDTKLGEIMLGDNDESVIHQNIPSFNSSDLIIPKEK